MIKQLNNNDNLNYPTTTIPSATITPSPQQSPHHHNNTTTTPPPPATSIPQWQSAWHRGTRHGGQTPCGCSTATQDVAHCTPCLGSPVCFLTPSTTPRPWFVLCVPSFLASTHHLPSQLYQHPISALPAQFLPSTPLLLSPPQLKHKHNTLPQSTTFLHYTFLLQHHHNRNGNNTSRHHTQQPNHSINLKVITNNFHPCHIIFIITIITTTTIITITIITTTTLITIIIIITTTTLITIITIITTTTLISITTITTTTTILITIIAIITTTTTIFITITTITTTITIITTITTIFITIITTITTIFITTTTTIFITITTTITTIIIITTI